MLLQNPLKVQFINRYLLHHMSAYKFLLTLSVAEVACERSFSTLKYIKNRLGSTLSKDHLSAFMLMSTEKDILMTLDTYVVIDKDSEKSNNLRKLLTY